MHVDDSSADISTAATHSPVILYLMIVVMGVGLAAQAVPSIAKILGPIGSWLTRRSEERRRIAVAADDSDIAELKRQVDNLTQWRAEQDERNRIHSEWDRQAYAALTKAGIDVDLPPSLI